MNRKQQTAAHSRAPRKKPHGIAHKLMESTAAIEQLAQERKLKQRRKEALGTATMSVEEVSDRLGIGRNQTYQAVRGGRIPAIRIGKRWLISTAVVDEILSGREAV